MTSLDASLFYLLSTVDFHQLNQSNSFKIDARSSNSTNANSPISFLCTQDPSTSLHSPACCGPEAFISDFNSFYYGPNSSTLPQLQPSSIMSWSLNCRGFTLGLDPSSLRYSPGCILPSLQCLCSEIASIHAGYSSSTFSEGTRPGEKVTSGCWHPPTQSHWPLEFLISKVINICII